MTENVPDYTNCYVAYFDILGFEKLVEKSADEAETRKVLIELLSTIARMRLPKYSQRNVKYEGAEIAVENEKYFVLQNRTFSDSVLLFVPADSHQLSSLLDKIRFVHDLLLGAGCFLRGAITLGGMYWHDSWCLPGANSVAGSSAWKDRDDSPQELVEEVAAHVSIGPALVEAYKLESEIAIHPRLIFSGNLIRHITEMENALPRNATEKIHRAVKAFPLCSPSSDNAGRSVSDFIRSDSDGIPYFDFFNGDIARNDTKYIHREQLHGGGWKLTWVRKNQPYDEFMRDGRAVIEDQMQSQTALKVRAKYMWLAKYFNEYVSHCGVEPVELKW